MKQIKVQYIKGMQRAYIRKFKAEDDICHPDRRIIGSNERVIQEYLDKITHDTEEQRKISDIVKRETWNSPHLAFKQILYKLTELGYEIV